MSHAADYAWGPLMAVLSDFHSSLIPNGIIESLKSFTGEHTFTAQAYYPPYDKVPRNITTWLSTNLTIGAESYDENVVGGPSKSQESFNPAVIQWTTGDEIAFMSVSICLRKTDAVVGSSQAYIHQLYPTEMALQADVSPARLNLRYPHGNASSIFTLVVSAFTKQRILTGWEGVQNLNVTVSGNVDPSYSLSFAGQYGGTSKLLRDFEFWNFTYIMPKDFEGVPNLCLDLQLS